jgi:hypothetical protein
MNTSRVTALDSNIWLLIQAHMAAPVPGMPVDALEVRLKAAALATKMGNVSNQCVWCLATSMEDTL